MRWKMSLFAKILPRHVELLQLIDHFFLEKLRQHEKIKNDASKLQRLQLISTDESGEQVIKISHLCFLSCRQIFSLSMQQFESCKSIIYREMDDIFPQRLAHVPQGINPRQWL